MWRADFHLRHLNDEPRIGLVDSRFRAQGNRFLIAALTHANRGALVHGSHLHSGAMNGPTDSRADDGHTLAAACHGFEERRSNEAGVADGSTVPKPILGPSDFPLVAG